MNQSKCLDPSCRRGSCDVSTVSSYDCKTRSRGNICYSLLSSCSLCQKRKTWCLAQSQKIIISTGTSTNPNGVPEVSVGNPNGVPGVSHVVSNVAETDAVSKERFSRSSTLSFSLDSPIGGISTVHNHRSSTVQFPVKSCTLGLNSQAPGS